MSRLLADGRHRVRHRQGPPRPGRRRRDDRRPARPTATCGTAIRDELPKKGRETDAVERRAACSRASSKAPCTASTATTSRRFDALGGRRRAARAAARRPCSSSSATTPTCRKLVFDWIAGWEKTAARRHRRSSCPGNLAAVQQRRGRPLDRTGPNTILVDSRAARVRRGHERRLQEDRRRARSRSSRPSTAPRFPGRDADELTDEDLLREVMNTVGKPGKLGEHVRCVVSVSMLTEGWDANTVTHILGVRAFGTPAAVRAGRRPRPAPHELRRQRRRACSSPSTPRSTACRSPSSRRPAPGRAEAARSRSVAVRALDGARRPARSPSRASIGYRYELPDRAARRRRSTDESRLVALDRRTCPTRTEIAPIVGETDDARRSTT